MTSIRDMMRQNQGGVWVLDSGGVFNHGAI